MVINDTYNFEMPQGLHKKHIITLMENFAGSDCLDLDYLENHIGGQMESDCPKRL
jgi:hypothetical protein